MEAIFELRQNSSDAESYLSTDAEGDLGDEPCALLSPQFVMSSSSKVTIEL